MSDEQFTAQGARIVPDADALFAEAELVQKVKEPQAEEVGLLREGQTLFTYLHLAAEPELAHGLRESGATCIAYETVEDAEGRLPQSLAAIRASVDSVFVMETQRLNRMMVILTIAIAGGPFIGLLGTVIGVMITFAAIAAAGDVNVNAIAPGISAALLATVAGLAVAIPALFGYNYFTVRIREISAEMQIFLDELITRMAEGVRVRSLRQPAE